MEYSILLKCIILYFVLLITLKLMGKREIGQLSLFDFVILLIISDIGVNGINEELNFLNFIIPIVVLCFIQRLISIILLKVPKLRQVFDGKESVIIDNGKICYQEMRKIGYNFDDLVTQLRLKNIRSLSEVDYAILETNGEISVFRKNASNEEYPINSSSNALNTTSKSLKLNPFPVIISGCLKKENIKRLKIGIDYVLKLLKEKGYEDYKTILYASYEDNNLFIIDSKNLK